MKFASILPTALFISTILIFAKNAKSAPDASRKYQTLTVASSNNFPPINILNEKNELLGFGSDIADAVLKANRVAVKHIHSSHWNEVLKWLDTGQADIIHDTGYNLERTKYLEFTTPIIEMPEVIFVRKEQLDIHDFNSLKQKTVACVKNHISHLYLKKFPQIKCHLVDTPLEGIYALLSQKVDAYVYPQQIIEYYSQKLRFTNRLKIVGTPLRTLKWSMTVKKGNHKIKDLLNQGLAKIKASGEYDRIYNKWFGRQLLSGYSSTEVTIIIYAAILISLMAGSLLVLFITNYRIQEANKKVREIDLKYQLAMDATQDGVWDWNMINDTVYYGPMWNQLLKLDSIPNSYSFWKERIHPEYISETVSTLQMHLDGKTEVWSQEHRLRDSVGDWIWVLGRGKVVERRQDGTPMRMVGTITNISERKNSELDKHQLQEQLMRSQKLESIGQLTGGIAHDFNNLLGIIKGSAGILNNRLNTHNDPKIVKHLKFIQDAVKRSSDLISQMLLFSRHDQKKSVPILVSPLLKNDIKMLRSTIPATVEIESKIEEGVPLVKISAAQLNQLVINLGINARDAVDGSGRLTIKLKFVRNLKTELSIAHVPIRGDWVVLSFADSGPGIEPKLVSSIFNPFFTTKGVGKGSGMGLSIVYRIMENLDGHIVLKNDSSNRNGTTFCLFFPPVFEVSEKTPNTMNTPDERVCDRPRRSDIEVLVVDDEDALASQLHEQLEENGFIPCSMSDGNEALELFKQNPDRFTLLVTDQTMPKMTGLDLSSKIRSIRSDFPIIMCSGYSDQIDATKAAELDIHYIAKPIEFNALLAKIFSLIDSKR
jgi:signal transduction histidine kinase/ABC-type amino acid transport substrate-binding protein/CheY-like chemotaxis protein